MKKIISLFLTMCIIASVCAFMPLSASAATSGTCGDNLTWTLDDEGKLTISGTGDMTYAFYLNAVWSISNVTSVEIKNGVTSISHGAFMNFTNLTSITIPDSVTSIGDWVFQDCSNLTSIAIPKSVTSIGAGAFLFCSKLTAITVDSDNAKYCSIDDNLFNKEKTQLIQYAIGKNATQYTIPDSVTSIGDNAFYGCSLTSITMPNSVTSIGDNAFYGCSLTSITIPNSVTSIGDLAFSYCDLTSVIIPKSVTTVGRGIFYRCNKLAEITVDSDNTKYCSIDGNLFNKEKTQFIQYAIGKNATQYTIPDSVTSIGKWAFGGCSKLTSITIPDSVTSIGDWVFQDCSNLTSITIPDSVTTIDDYVFQDCNNLASIAIPKSVTSIGEWVFRDCNKLAEITVDSDNTKYCSIDGNLFNKEKTQFIQYAIGKNATQYTIPDSVTSIGDGAFYGCSLTSITIPNSVTSIGGSAFSYCDLTNVTIPNSVTTIDMCAFGYCSDLTNVTIPKSVTTIGYLAFNGCPKLAEITVDPDNTKYCSVDGNLFNKEKTELIQYAEGKSDTQYTIPSGVSNIGEMGYNKLTSIIIPGSVTTIDAYAFSGSTALTDVYYEGSAEDWGKIINSDDTYLTYATKHYNYTAGADTGGENLTWTLNNGTLTISGTGNMPVWESYKDVPWNSSDSSITSVVINSGITSIGNTAFAGCTNLTSVTIPNGVTSIGQYAFSGCKKLESIALPNGITSIGDGAFSNCEKLASIALPGGITSIGQYAFSGCGELTSITIPDKVTSVGAYAFQSCRKLTSITIPNSVTSIGEWVFQDCSNLTSVAIPKSVTSIGADAFFNCRKLTAITVDSDNAKYCSIDGNLLNKEKREFIHYAEGKSDTQYTIPDGVTSIGIRALQSCDKLTSITIPNSVTTIGQQAFNWCTELTSIAIPSGATSIGPMAFWGCEKLANVTIPVGVTAICEAAFSECTALTDVYYEGSADDWGKITIDIENTELTNATIHYNHSIAAPKTPQTIAIADFGEKTYGDTAFAISVTPDATSKLDSFTYTSGNTAVATISDKGQITIVGAGEANITVTQAGSDEYAAASDTKTLKVNPKSVTVKSIDLSEKTAFLEGILTSDADKVALDFDKIETTVIDVAQTKGETTTVTSTVKVENFKLTGEKAGNYIANETPITTTVSSTTVSDNLTEDENTTIVAALVDEKTLVVTDIAVTGEEETDEKTVAIDATGVENTAIETVAFTKTVVDSFADDTSLSVKMKDGNAGDASIVLNANAVSAIKSAANIREAKTISISVVKMEKDELSDKEAEKVDDAKTPTIYSITITDEDGNNMAGDFGEGGTAKVTLAYTKPSGNGTIGVVCLNKDGSTTAVANPVYDSTNHMVTVTLSHFSKYMIYTEPERRTGGGGGGGGASSYTVKFETNGGSAVDSVKVDKNKTVTVPTAPTKDGFEFAGWYTDKELSTAYDFDTKVTKGMTLYAAWTEKKIEVKDDNTEPTTPENKITFTDVAGNEWFAENVTYVTENGLMNGVTSTEFAPNDNLTRAMLVAILYRAEGEPAVNKSIPFADVKADDYFANAVIWAQQNGIVSGVSENEFAPNENITREQIATIIYRFANYKGYDTSAKADISAYADYNEISEYAVEAVQYAVGSGLMKGKTETTLNPTDTATRAEIAAILQRFIEGNK